MHRGSAKWKGNAINGDDINVSIDDLVVAAQTRSGGFVNLSPKVLAISAHTILKLEQMGGTAPDDALLHQIVDSLRRHPKTVRQSVGDAASPRVLVPGACYQRKRTPDFAIFATTW